MTGYSNGGALPGQTALGGSDAFIIQTGFEHFSCHYSCETCVGAAINNCWSCDSANTFRNLKIPDNICECKEKSYDDGINSICQECQN